MSKLQHVKKRRCACLVPPPEHRWFKCLCSCPSPPQESDAASDEAQQRAAFMSAVTANSNLHFFRERRVWAVERSSHWWDRIVCEFSPDQWGDQLQSISFHYLCDCVRPYISRMDTNVRVVGNGRFAQSIDDMTRQKPIRGVVGGRGLQ